MGQLPRFKRRRCFTLLELLIVIVIIGTLATIAIPQYRKVVLKTRVAKAKHAISLINEAEKIYHSEEGSYEEDITTLSNATGIDLGSVESDDEWNYTVSNASAIITANKTNAPCQSATVTFNMTTGIFSIDSCFQ